MKIVNRATTRILFSTIFLIILTSWSPASRDVEPPQDAKRYLYVATPGVRNYLEYGGHGIVVFSIDNNHRFVKRIPTGGLKSDGTPSNVKGVAVSVSNNSIYISTLEALQRVDLATEKVLWEKTYEGGCDRMAISPDGQLIYLPSLEKEHWNVVDAKTGEVITRIVSNSGAHNTVYGSDGRAVYLAGLRTPSLGVADPKTHTVVKQVGTFGASIRPFTVNGSQTLCFVNVNELLGFEIGDIRTGKQLHRIAVKGFGTGPVKRHGCPSHGIGLTPDESEIWLCDSFNQRLHIFDNTVMPPVQGANIQVRDQPGWITFSLDGRYAYPSTGEIIDVASKKIVTTLKDEKGADVQSEKMVEIHMIGARAVRAGDQFGVGRVLSQ